MARSSWTYLKGERRTGEYEELTLRSVGHWWIGDDTQWPEAVREGFHIRSETGVDMVEPTRLHLSDRGAFRDPFKLTYRSFILQQDSEEKKLDGLVEGAKAAGAFAAPRPGLEDITARYIRGMRHAFWGFSMLQTYGAAYTPAGTAMNVLQLQAFDCMRHAQRFVELSWEIDPPAASGDESADAAPADAESGPNPWLDWAPMQPLRRFVELSLCNFDWGENLVLLNAVLLPLFRPVHHALLVDIPTAHGDWALPQFWLRLEEDMNRHIQQGRAFVDAVIGHDPRNREIVQDWIDRWEPLALAAIDGLGPVIDAVPGPKAMNEPLPRYASVRDAALAGYAGQLADCGLSPAPAGHDFEGGQDVAVGVSR